MLFITVACVQNTQSNEKSNGEEESVNGITQAYIMALEAILQEDPGLNRDMKYIAIDTKTLDDIAQIDREYILEYFKKYHKEILDASMEDLKKKGLFDEETLSIEGVLLTFEKINIKTNKLTIEGSKFKSGLGAIGMECIIKKVNNEWQLEESKMLWIS